MRLLKSVLSFVVFSLVLTPAFSAPRTPCELALLEATLEQAPQLNRKAFLAQHLLKVSWLRREAVSTTAWGMLADGMRSVVSRAGEPPAFKFAFGRATLKDLVAPFLSDFDTITKNDLQSNALARTVIEALVLELSGRITRFPFGEIAVDEDGIVLRVEAFEGESTLPRFEHVYSRFLLGYAVPDVTRQHAWSLLAHALVSANDGRLQVEIGKTRILELLEPFAHFLGGDTKANQKLLDKIVRALTARTNVFPFGTIQNTGKATGIRQGSISCLISSS